MSFTIVPTGALGDNLSDAYWNTYVRDNFRALWQYTAVGNFQYYNGSNLTTVSKPAATSVLTMGASGVPAWALSKNMSGHLNAKGTADFAPGQTFTTTWQDITNATTTLTTTATCTVMLISVVTGYNQNTGIPYPIYIREVINGDPNPLLTYPFNSDLPPRNSELPNIYYKTAVPAGSIICKLQCEIQTDYNIVTQGRLIALAFTE